MRIYFSPKVSLIGMILVVLMLRASVWQWHRHLEKQELIRQMQARLELPIVKLSEFLRQHKFDSVDNISFRRFEVEGDFDFAHEIILRNRMHGDLAGMHVLTPLKLLGSYTYILINRGFIPIERSKPDLRKEFQRDSVAKFVGLAKAQSTPSWYSPKDIRVGAKDGRLDAWHRVDLEKIQEQLPYKLEPFYLELMSVVEPSSVEKQVVKAESGREELLLMGLKQVAQFDSQPSALGAYPIPSFDTVIPPGRHLGYVYEWAFMALMTTLICLVLQLRPPVSR